jgi:TolA-binding protein
MKKLFNASALSVLIILGISCTSQRDKDIKAISGLEKQIEQEGAKPDPAKLTQLLDSYVAFAEHNATDSLAPNYLYKAVNLCIGVNNGIRAMQLIDQTLNDFPKSGYLPETIFLKAYVYENLLSDYGKASQVYNDFLKKYPTHDLADDAEAALKYLGKSPEEMVREFEDMAAQANAGE